MQSKEFEANYLAQLHYEIESGITQIFRIVSEPERENRPEEPIKLLEVNEDTVPAGIVPLQFAPVPSEGIHHASVIVEITPEEYRQLTSRELALPGDWIVGEVIPRQNGAANP